MLREVGERVIASDEELREIVESAAFARALEKNLLERRGIKLAGRVELIAKLLGARK